MPNISGSLGICAGGNTVLTSSTASGNQWFLNGNPVSGATGQTLTVSAAGSYTVQVTENGCAALSSPASVTQTIVAVPTISGNPTFCTASNTVLTSSALTGNQWLLNGNPVAGATNRTLTVTAAGSYSVTVAENGCSATSATVNVTESNAPAPVAANPAPICVGGTVPQLTASGSAIQWYSDAALTNPVGTGNAFTPSINNAIAGNSIFYVTQTVSNCQSPATQVTVAINPVPNAPTLSGILVFCAGGGTTLTSNAATGNQWLLNGNPIGGATGQTLAVTVAGNYSATVTSGNCTATSTPVAVKQSDLAATVAASNPNCTDPNSGALTVSASGGAAPYGYSLDGADFSNTTGVFGALAANNYTIYVKDAAGCVVTRTQGLSAIPGITAATLAPANESGCAKADGSVTVSGIAGAGGPYQYFINGTPNPAGINNNVFGGLVANTYSIRVVAANGCDLTQTVAVGTDCITCKLTASVASQTNPTCKGNDGTITLTSANGIGTVSYSIDGGTNFNTNPVFANLAAGGYAIVVKDGNGCVVNAGTVTLTPPVAIAAMVSGSNPTTCNVTDGTITVGNVTGGKAPYQYSLDGVNYQTASTFSGLAGNSYTVSVRDADGCVNTFSQTITAPDGISTVTVNTVSESGCLTLDGSVTVNAVGGKSPYKYYLNGTPNPAGINNNVFSGLEGKVYAIRVETADGCFFTTTAAVGTNCTTPCTLAATVTNTGLACNNAGNGQITVAASGGTGLYEYSLDGTAFQTAAIFNGLAAGNYTVTIRDRNNPACKITRNATITNPPAITGLVTATNNPSCQNNDGGLTVTASGGTGALQYALNGGTYTNSLTFNGLTAGTYTVTAKDANNCVQAIGTATLTAPAAIMGTATGSNPTTCAAKDGQITVGNVLNGTAPYQYSIDGATFQASATLTGLGEGVYQVTVKDANGCTAMLPGVTLKVNVTITATLVPANPGSCTTTDGSITINNAAGGTAPYQYSLDGGPFQSGNIFVNLADKKTPYTLTIRDANGCTAALSVSLTAPNSITAISISATDETSCNGKDGTVTVGSVTGGKAPYQYFINGIVNPAGANSNVFGNLAGGSYNIRVVTADGCDFTAAASVKPACCLQAVVAATTQPGCAGNDGSITLSATSGVGAVQYSINGGIGFSASGTFTGLASGNYTILVRDSICQKDLGTVTLTGVPLAATLAGTNPSGCLAANGTITISNVTGGTAPYQYSIDGVNYAANATFANLSGGNYTVFLKDASGCIIDFTQILAPVGGILSVETVTVSESGCNSKDGQITVTNVTGTAGPYQYFVDGVLNPAGGGNNVFTGLASGPHQVRVVAANGCDFLANAVVGSNCVADCKAITTVTAQTNPTCAGSDGSITVGLSGGTGTVTYSIDGGTTFVTTNVFTGLASGNYTILVRYGAGCQTSVPATLTLPATITATVSGTNPTGCGLQDGVISITLASGGTAPYRYSIDGASFRSRTTYTGLTSGVYTVYVRDANGCVFTFSQTLSVSGGITSLAVNAQAESRCNLADGSITVANVVGAAGPYEYYLNGAANPNGLGNNVFANLPPADYTIKVIAANACEFTQMVKVAGPNCPPCTLAANTNKTDPDCSAPNSGGINVLVSGGTQPYEYSFNGAAFAAGNGKFTSLVAGDYTVSVRDFSGCVLALPTVRLLSIAPVSDAVVKITNPSGCNSNDGAVTIDNVSGGTPSYQYSMDGVNYQSANQFNGLGAGTYMAYVRDARGCVLTKTFALKSPTGITATATVADESACKAIDGRVTVSVTNASGAVEYYLNGTPNPAGINNNVFAGLAPGSYAIRVRDASGCEFTNAVAIKTFACPACALVISTSGTNPTSCALNNGAITTTVTSGTAPYAFSLDGTDFTNTTGRFTGLPGGSYTVYVKDATGCLVTQPQTLSAPSGITATTLTATVETGCNKADGTITVGSVTGGIAPYQYFIDGTLNPAGANSNVFAGLLPKSYSVRVVDANNCAFANTVSVGTACTVNCTLAATATGTNITSCTVTDGTIAVTATGGTAPYQYSKDGGATYQAAANFTGLAAGSYNVFVKDAGNCVVNRTVALTAPSGLAATAAINDETACKANDGTITVSVTGGTAPYKYYLNGTLNPAGNVFGALLPNTYTIRVTDANNCEFTTTATVKTFACPPPTCTITAQAFSNPVLCNGVSDGTAILINVSGGSGAYEFSIDNGATYQANPQFNSLAAGNYTILARDKNNVTCTAPFAVTIATKFDVAGIIIVNQPKTCGDKGKITFTNVFGGQAPYQFSVNGTTFGTDTVFADLLPGKYQATIRDAKNCRFSAEIAIIGGQAITATVAQGQPASCRQADGTITIANASGGSGVFVYSLDGTTFSGNTTFDKLAAGAYTVYVKEQNGSCVATFAVNVRATDCCKLTLNPALTQPTACTSVDGRITLAMTDGLAPFTYRLNNGAPQNSNVFGGLGNGNYTILVRDATGCEASVTVTLASPNAITAQVEQVTPASCFGKADGSVRVVSVGGGSGSYEYSMDGAAYQNSPLFANLKANIYVLYVRDKASGCLVSYPVTVNEATQITATVTPTNATVCAAKDGSIRIANVAGGVGPYQYSLDSLANYQTTNQFNGLGNRTYKVYIKDTRGCMAVYAARVNSPNAISVGTPVLLNPTCQGSNNGEIRTGTITGGQAPYQYSLNNGAYQLAGIFTALPAGNYTLKIKDQSGCEYPFEYTLTEPAAIAFDVRQTRTPTCADPTGSVEVINIVGGIPPYKYSLDGVDFQNSPVFGSLNPGDYIMYVRDVSKNTCASTKPFTIRGAKRVAFEVKAVSIGCSNTDKGSIAVYRITGGIETGSPVEYGISINGGNTFRYISSDSTFFANLDAGIYDIVIEYGTNCKTAAQRVFINAGAIPFSVNTTPATCGAANGSATVDIANPVPGKVYYYSMDNLNYFTTPGFPSLRSGSYRMYVRENRQDTCANIKSFVVPGPDSVRYAIRRQDCNTVIVDNIGGGVAPYRISISGRAAITTGELFTSRYVFPNLQDGEYTMTVTDKEGCSTFPFNFRVGNRISYKVKTTPSVLEEPTGGLQIYDITGGQPPYEVSVDGQQWSRIKDRTIPIDTIITGLPVGLLKVYIRDANGCIKQLDAEVKELKFVVPNIFTPNGDGFNDTFFITKLPSGTFMTIVDRWGRVVFESRDYKNDWDGGTYPDGVYFYTIDIAGEQTYRGWVQVWRRAE